MDWIVRFPLVVLAVFAVMLGFLGTPAWPWFQSFLESKAVHSQVGHLFESEVLALMGLSAVIVFLVVMERSVSRPLTRMIGVLGEYIGKLLSEIKARPVYFVAEHSVKTADESVKEPAKARPAPTRAAE